MLAQLGGSPFFRRGRGLPGAGESPEEWRGLVALPWKIVPSSVSRRRLRAGGAAGRRGGRPRHYPCYLAPHRKPRTWALGFADGLRPSMRRHDAGFMPTAPAGAKQPPAAVKIICSGPALDKQGSMNGSHLRRTTQEHLEHSESRRNSTWTRSMTGLFPCGFHGDKRVSSTSLPNIPLNAGDRFARRCMPRSQRRSGGA